MQEIDVLLREARELYAAGSDEMAQARYLEILKTNPCQAEALSELAALASSRGYRSAARTAYHQAMRCHPSDALAAVNLGNLELQDENWQGAREHFEAALRINEGLAEAHQGLARALTALGEHSQARSHFQRGFTGHALTCLPYRGRGRAQRVLLLVSTHFGNIAVREFLDDRHYELLVLHVEYADPAQSLPAHDVVFNAIGDADLCAGALEAAARVARLSNAPVINAPERVRRTTRLENSQRLSRLPGTTLAATRQIARADLPGLLAGSGFDFPILIRSPGFHMGSHFVKVQDKNALAAAAAKLPGEQLLLMQFLDARGSDGMTRKYRVMIIGGRLYPLHLAIAPQWKVHYFSASMASEPAFRDEEQRFLEDMVGTLGDLAITALSRVATELGLEYAGIDFGLGANGSVLLFEANATMVIAAPPADPMWDYRRPAVERARAAAAELVRTSAKLRQAAAGIPR
jgi:glutathione synthase/RimK-type ligase-like ATP-grasp enzyme